MKKRVTPGPRGSDAWAVVVERFDESDTGQGTPNLGKGSLGFSALARPDGGGHAGVRFATGRPTSSPPAAGPCTSHGGLRAKIPSE